MGEEKDLVDWLLQLAILGTFVLFAVAIWSIKREKDKEAKSKRKEADKQRLSEQ
ncbi:MAG: hypothetical protein ACYSR6_06310 [Planctomycetota bacterium]